MDENRMRLKALIDLLGITVAETARLAGCSRSLLSRYLGGDDGVNVERYVGILESRLPELVARRTRPYFRLQPVPVEAVDALARLAYSPSGGTRND